MSTLSVGTIKSNTTTPPTIQNSSGTEVGTFCRAWVNFNGAGTVAINAAFNVSSITDSGVGNYVINFVTPFPDTNYTFTVGMQRDSGGMTSLTVATDSTGKTAAGLRLYTGYGASATLFDSPNVNAAFFR